MVARSAGQDMRLDGIAGAIDFACKTVGESSYVSLVSTAGGSLQGQTICKAHFISR